MRMTVIVCDECRDKDRETKRYEIKVGSARATLDLCDEHAGPILRLHALKAPSGETPIPKRTGRARVKTMAEIEAEKRARNKKE